MRFLHVLAFLPASFAGPALNSKAAPTVVIAAPEATFVGTNNGGVDIFNGIPYAQPPIETLRLKPPQSIIRPLGTVEATATALACSQMLSNDLRDLPFGVFGLLDEIPFLQTFLNQNVPQGEDCLTINIRRPAGTVASANLPVVFWIYGGSFELGSTSQYDGMDWVVTAINTGKPMIYVSVNYRVNGFGFMPGKEILEEGSANLGLLDQRLALQWVADNIAFFGGDPEKVTLWGESAGAWSAFDQLALYDGNHTYKGKPLYRGAILNSGSYLPADPVDCPKAQVVYDGVVSAAGCSMAVDTLACLRSLDYQSFRNAVNSAPGFLSYSSLDLSYLPRPDGKVLTQSPDALAAAGRFAAVPLIIGDQEDEGTLFSFFQYNITDTIDLVAYLQQYYFNDATADQVAKYVATYPSNQAAGSPYRTGSANEFYSTFKRLASIQGDFLFTLTRRAFLNSILAHYPSVPTFSYIATYYHGTAFLGTNHGSDLKIYYPSSTAPSGSGNVTLPSASIHNYFNNFIHNLDPNNASGTISGGSCLEWPQWGGSKQLINFSSAATELTSDDFRRESFAVLQNLTDVFRM